MSMTLRSAASSFLFIPPIFRRKAERRVEPTLRRAAPVTPAPKPAPAPAPAPKPGQVDLDKLLAATRKAPVELAVIEWDGDTDCEAAAIVPTENAEAQALLDNDPRGYDARCRRIRDRYIGARFSGVVRSAADLESADRVVKSARLYFEDAQAETALELLDMAIEQDSRAEALWLAELEILFLGRDAQRFVECARAFHALHPASEAWLEVSRLGHALAPREALFASAAGPREHDHYGPWPDLPNWIQANWDLTSEVLAADMHRIMKRRAHDARLARAKPQLAA
jgi:hypothetical protein